jgi:hypothetical protein
LGGHLNLVITTIFRSLPCPCEVFKHPRVKQRQQLATLTSSKSGIGSTQGLLRYIH